VLLQLSFLGARAASLIFLGLDFEGMYSFLSLPTSTSYFDGTLLAGPGPAKPK